MSKEKYLRLSPGNTADFAWSRTSDGEIICRDKDDNEILLVVEQPLDQKDLIAGGYHAGLTTGLSISARYIEFLEELTAPLMPDYEPIPAQYYERDYDTHVEKFEFGPHDEYGHSENYHVKIQIDAPLIETVDTIIATFENTNRETFYATAVAEAANSSSYFITQRIYACPDTGLPASIFMNAKTYESFMWMSETSGHGISNILYTAISTMATDCMKQLSKCETEPSPAPVEVDKRRMQIVSHS